MPKTFYGKWSVGFILGFLLFLSIFYLVIKAGYRGGDSFFSNPFLVIPILMSAACGIMSFSSGMISIFKQKERNLLVIISTILGLFVLLMVLGEILTPH